MALILAVMIVIPSVLLIRPHLHHLTGRYEKLNVPAGQAISAILREGRDRPSVVVASDLQLGGDVRLHAPAVAVMVPGYEAFDRPSGHAAADPVLLIWRGEGEPVPQLPDDLRQWLIARVPGADMTRLQVRDIALPYNAGREPDRYHFGYAWVYPAR